MIKIEYTIPFITLFLGYYLGKKEWKKQFNLSHFDLHEKVFNKIKNIFNDESGKYYFSLSDKEIKEKIKSHFILPDSEYFKKLKEKKSFLPNDYLFPLFDIKPLIKELRKLSSRSNKKISKITKKIINIHDEEMDNLSSKIELLFDSYRSLNYGLCKEEEKYIEYLSHEREELVLLKIMGLIKNLEKELNNFLKNKE